jgi:hypothetical protein
MPGRSAQDTILTLAAEYRSADIALMRAVNDEKTPRSASRQNAQRDRLCYGPADNL